MWGVMRVHVRVCWQVQEQVQQRQAGEQQGVRAEAQRAGDERTAQPVPPTGRSTAAEEAGQHRHQQHLHHDGDDGDGDGRPA